MKRRAIVSGRRAVYRPTGEVVRVVGEQESMFALRSRLLVRFPEGTIKAVPGNLVDTVEPQR